MRRALSFLVALGVLGLALWDGDTASSVGATVAAPVSATPPALPPPPLPARATNAIHTLRQLLAMTPGERDAAIASKSDRHKTLIREQLRILESLDPAGRESRLRLLELRLVMDPLLQLHPVSREPILNALPASRRAYVESQLQIWDRLPEESRARLLAENRGWVPLAGTNSALAAATDRRLPPLPPPGFRDRLEDDLQRWSSLDARDREHALSALNQYFRLSSRDQDAVRARLDAGSRQRIQHLQASFVGLDAETRDRTVAAFLHFAAMPDDERTRFWRNADRWKAMTPDERRAWRALTAHLPPLPPGLGFPLPEPPPSPSPGFPGTNAQAAR